MFNLGLVLLSGLSICVNPCLFIYIKCQFENILKLHVQRGGSEQKLNKF